MHAIQDLRLLDNQQSLTISAYSPRRNIDQAAASVSQVCEADNPDLWEYLIDLRESILQFYVGLLQGLIEAKSANQISVHIPKIVDFAVYATQESFKPTVDMLLTSLGLIGDIVSAYRENVRLIVEARLVLQFLERTSSMQDARVNEAAKFAKTALLGKSR